MNVAHPAPGELAPCRQPALRGSTIVLRRLRGLALHLEPELRAKSLLSCTQSAPVEEGGPLRTQRREPVGGEARCRLEVDDEAERGTGSAHGAAITPGSPTRPDLRAAARGR